MSSARARQLLAGCTPRLEGSEKPARLAQKEVREGKIRKLEPGAAVESCHGLTAEDAENAAQKHSRFSAALGGEAL